MRAFDDSFYQIRGHIPALDGLRGIAILLVLAVHFGAKIGEVAPVPDPVLRVTGSGWIGVDLFFVLSGFLITGILLDSKGRARFFTTFYARRVLRIFPLYYAYLVLVFLIIPALFEIPSERFAELRDAQGWYWLYLSNFRNAILGSWGTDGIVTTHFWSLAVEEQFYMVWPFIVYALSPRKLTALCVGIIGLTPFLRLALRLEDVNVIAVYVLTVTRMDALAMGALLSLAVRGRVLPALMHRWTTPVAVATGFSVVIMFWLRGPSQFDKITGTAGHSLLALGGAVLVLLAVTGGPPGPVRRALASPVLRFFGKYSYSLYVFHLPIVGLLTLPASVARVNATVGSGQSASVVLLGIALTATVGASLLSWYLFEKHFLSLKRLVPYEQK